MRRVPFHAARRNTSIPDSRPFVGAHERFNDMSGTSYSGKEPALVVGTKGMKMRVVELGIRRIEVFKRARKVLRDRSTRVVE